MEGLQWFFSQWWGIMTCIIIVLVIICLFYRLIFKRLFDILISGVALIVLSPLFVFLSILIRVKLGKPILFRQSRPGKNEKIFSLIKFRTMTDAKDENGNLLPDEKRITKFGRILRSTSVDELPELWNIFCGEMSIVGPRPLLTQYLPLYNEDQKKRHRVRPGLTGLAQVNGRNASSWDERFAYDQKYVEKYNIFMDISIFFKTVVKVLKREGISHEGEATMQFFTGNEKINVLILSCGRRVELVKAFKEARDRLGINGTVIGADCCDTAPALYFADRFYIIPKIGADDYFSNLKQIIEKEKISLVVPTIDTELLVLSKLKSEFENLGAKLLVPSCDVVKICNDKKLTAEFFEKNGFNYPKTLLEDDCEAYGGEFPLIIKPCDGSSSKNVFKINTKEELRFFKKYIPDHIVQKFVTGQEYTVDVLTDFNGKLIYTVPRKRISVRGGEILKGQIDKNKIVIEETKRLIEKLGAIGQLTIQGFLGCDNKFSFIEINPRFGGGAPMSIKAGANFCEVLYRLLKGEEISFLNDYQDGQIIVRFDDSIVLKND